MSIQAITSDLIVDLSTEEQQLLSGGVSGSIKTKGTLKFGGKSFPISLSGTVKGLSKDDDVDDGGDDED
ncbi:MAG: hypothetical protein V7K68_30565 [Nostoc sp.]|uniref:hypothetical protein n=1 Tax=Nostoc sp. TaxID=1180 RepID=UPI002FF73E88